MRFTGDVAPPLELLFESSLPRGKGIGDFSQYWRVTSHKIRSSSVCVYWWLCGCWVIYIGKEKRVIFRLRCDCRDCRGWVWLPDLPLCTEKTRPGGKCRSSTTNPPGYRLDRDCYSTPIALARRYHRPCPETTILHHHPVFLFPPAFRPRRRNSRTLTPCHLSKPARRHHQ